MREIWGPQKKKPFLGKFPGEVEGGEGAPRGAAMAIVKGGKRVFLKIEGPLWGQGKMFKKGKGSNPERGKRPPAGRAQLRAPAPWRRGVVKNRGGNRGGKRGRFLNGVWGVFWDLPFKRDKMKTQAIKQA